MARQRGLSLDAKPGVGGRPLGIDPGVDDGEALFRASPFGSGDRPDVPDQARTTRDLTTHDHPVNAAKVPLNQPEQTDPRQC
jgi:hypothetical protein